jgi:hypothetical protein
LNGGSRPAGSRSIARLLRDQVVLKTVYKRTGNYLCRQR